MKIDPLQTIKKVMIHFTHSTFNRNVADRSISAQLHHETIEFGSNALQL